MGSPLIPELRELRRRIQREQLDIKDAARQIGVGVDTLERHLAGEYVRSDSLAKYRRWLAGTPRVRAEKLALVQTPSLEPHRATSSVPRLPQGVPAKRSVPERPYLVVDLFSGAGGMSAGFDLLDGGDVFETVMAIDSEEPMVRVFNANHRSNGREHPVCRRIDLSDLLNEAEVLCLYLDHLARIRADAQLRDALDRLPVVGLSTFISLIRELDHRFVQDLGAIRRSLQYKSDWKLVPAGVMLQTSVVGFHETLGLPITSSSPPELGALVWSEASGAGGRLDTLRHPAKSAAFRKLVRVLRPAMQHQWDQQLRQLAARAEGAGRGQLASSAARIRSFLPFMQSASMQQIKSLWLKWRSERQAARMVMFDEQTHEALAHLYNRDDRRVSVLLGGPPCQGFSRIGRGKLRSLFEQQVHVQADAETGDVRNRLLYKYVLFVSALAPSVFLFENVRHFHSEVRTPEGTFLATDVLAEAIRNVSSAALRYDVASRVIDASKHLVPQTRERFFMAGVRSETRASKALLKQVPEWCLTLPEHEPVPVRVVLDGLPDPISIDHARANGSGLHQTVNVAEANGYRSESARRVHHWVRQPAPRGDDNGAPQHVDSHHVRAPRRDDADLFSLFGPGKRWMDYRCDGVETLQKLRAALELLEQITSAAKEETKPNGRFRRILHNVDVKELRELRDVTDGSLSLRLLLETIPPMPGELTHHLRTKTYLSKRDGNHGDWLARLAPDRPSKTIMSHMAKDTYGYVHPVKPRTLSVREAARIQTFPDWYSFGSLGLVEAFRVVGNAVPPRLSHQLAERVAHILQRSSVLEPVSAPSQEIVAAGHG
jgi:site-specific DNA-cytosine methylase